MPEPQEPFIGEDGKLHASGNRIAYTVGHMRVFVCTDHEGHWPVGVASVVVAADEVGARALLDAELLQRGLRKAEPYTLREIDLSRPGAHVLNDGDY